MKIRTIITATCAAPAFSETGAVSAHNGEAQTVTKNFEAAIPNLPGKSLVALEVDCAPGAASPSHTHAKSAFIYAYVLSGVIESKVNQGETASIGRARAGPKRRVRPIRSAVTRARPSEQSCSPSSSSTPMTTL
jgi:hypothetical protein